VAEDLHCTYIDIHKLFVDKHGKLDANYTADGLHLTPTGGGYEKMGWLSAQAGIFIK
jgi:hypothetical protein